MHAKLFIRLNFHRSKSAKISASMPTESKAPHTEATPQNRRASLPHNLKIPAITITPPTPEMVELSSDSDEDLEMQSTPELDVIASAAATEVERENCSNYAKGLERRRRKTLEEGGEDK